MKKRIDRYVIGALCLFLCLMSAQSKSMAEFIDYYTEEESAELSDSAQAALDDAASAASELEAYESSIESETSTSNVSSDNSTEDSSTSVKNTTTAKNIYVRGKEEGGSFDLDDDSTGEDDSTIEEDDEEEEEEDDEDHHDEDDDEDESDDDNNSDDEEQEPEESDDGTDELSFALELLGVLDNNGDLYSYLKSSSIGMSDLTNGNVQTYMDEYLQKLKILYIAAGINDLSDAVETLVASIETLEEEHNTTVEDLIFIAITDLMNQSAFSLNADYMAAVSNILNIFNVHRSTMSISSLTYGDISPDDLDTVDDLLNISVQAAQGQVSSDAHVILLLQL